MEILFFSFVFILGLIAGSFLNSVIYRLSKKESFFWGRSYCPHCGHVLEARDLIPLASFILLKGRCRYCQKPISLQYPLVEFFTALLFLTIFSQNIDLIFTLSLFSFLKICFLLIISSFLVVIFVYDWRHYIIPDRMIYPAVLITGGWRFLLGFPHSYLNLGEPGLLDSFLAALGAAGFFLLIVLVSQGKGMGMGDVKLAFLMGLVLGFPGILVALFLSFFFGAIIGIILIILGKKKLKSEVPFGPFLVTGTLLTLFFQEGLIRFYLNLLFIE